MSFQQGQTWNRDILPTYTKCSTVARDATKGSLVTCTKGVLEHPDWTAPDIGMVGYKTSACWYPVDQSDSRAECHTKREVKCVKCENDIWHSSGELPDTSLARTLHINAETEGAPNRKTSVHYLKKVRTDLTMRAPFSLIGVSRYSPPSLQFLKECCTFRACSAEEEIRVSQAVTVA